MSKICIFGGTTEGRKLAEFLSGQPCDVMVCVATDYGQTLLPGAEHVSVSARRLPVGEIVSLLTEKRFDLVIDATHPYAQSITKSIARACRETGTLRWRLLRGASGVSSEHTYVETVSDAAAFLAGTEGNILLTTGSKELAKFSQLPGFSERVWARVLPLQSSLDACAQAGLPASHIFAMQGPFSEAMNAAMLRTIGAQYLVTKDGGAPGGFEEKESAAKSAGARLVVIGRPPEEEGLSLSKTISALCAKFGFSPKPEVFIAGIGPGSEALQTQEVRAAIRRADCLIGAKRMLDAVAGPQQLTIDAIAPETIASHIAQHPECGVFCVVMSGDTGFYSGTKKLLPLLKECRVRVLPGLSSMSYLCARLGVSYEDAVPVSLHGRDLDIAREVRRRRKVFTLVGGDGGMQALCERLTQAGLGHVRIAVGERLSYPDEAITRGTAQELRSHTFDKLSAALIENDTPNEIVTPGLPDEAFLRNLEPGKLVPMTKSEVRSICLSKLRLTPNAVCWDVGAGTGSVSIEMARLCADGFVYAIEKNEQAQALLEKNRESFSASNMQIIPGLAPEACRDLPAPTHAFLGGTSGSVRDILALLLEKNPRVRIVATAVTLESVSALSACMEDFEAAECVSVQVSKAAALGQYHLMQAQNPVYIFTLQNGGTDA
ncbi:MAG: precorrin-6A reductase [Firmicutes bacterium]|nr:precorrin-6A reductase [Bacillota bacterium]